MYWYGIGTRTRVWKKHGFQRRGCYRYDTLLALIGIGIGVWNSWHWHWHRQAVEICGECCWCSGYPCTQIHMHEGWRLLRISHVGPLSSHFCFPFFFERGQTKWHPPNLSSLFLNIQPHDLPAVSNWCTILRCRVATTLAAVAVQVNQVGSISQRIHDHTRRQAELLSERHRFPMVAVRGRRPPVDLTKGVLEVRFSSSA